MKGVRAAYFILGIILILISCGIYWFAIVMYRLEQEEAFHEMHPGFWGFFSGRAFYWYIVINAPAIVGIALFFLAPKARPHRA